MPLLIPARLPPKFTRCSNASSKSSMSTVLAAPLKTMPRYGVNNQSAEAGLAIAVTKSSTSVARITVLSPDFICTKLPRRYALQT